jgi:hypothetical protein
MAWWHHWRMGPSELLAALRRADGEAFSTCILVLEDSRATITADWEAHVQSANLLAIYERRSEHVARVALPTLGIPETIERLRATPHKTLRLAAVSRGNDAHPQCVVFFAPDDLEAVAAIAVLGSAPVK